MFYVNTKDFYGLRYQEFAGSPLNQQNLQTVMKLLLTSSLNN